MNSDDVTTVLEEVNEELDRSHIEQRVADWKKRIDDLYDLVETWLKPDWQSRRINNDIIMYEQLMEKYGVKPVKLPSLFIEEEGRQIARISPRGLWIIGVNGRLDLVLDKNLFVIVDRAEFYASPEWEISPITDRRNLKALDRKSFVEAIEQ